MTQAPRLSVFPCHDTLSEKPPVTMLSSPKVVLSTPDFQVVKITHIFTKSGLFCVKETYHRVKHMSVHSDIIFISVVFNLYVNIEDYPEIRGIRDDMLSVLSKYRVNYQQQSNSHIYELNICYM